MLLDIIRFNLHNLILVFKCCKMNIFFWFKRKAGDRGATTISQKTARLVTSRYKSYVNTDRESYLKGKEQCRWPPCTILDHWLLILKLYIFYKLTPLGKEVNCTEPSLSVRFPGEFFYPKGKESSLIGKAQYIWPPCTNQFRSAVFDITSMIFFFYEDYLNEEVNCTESSPSVSVPCMSIT